MEASSNQKVKLLRKKHKSLKIYLKYNTTAIIKCIIWKYM